MPAQRRCNARPVKILWRETGGPPVSAPSHDGYGTSLICDLIPHELGGTVDLAFSPEGVSCKIEIPLKPDLATSHERSSYRSFCRAMIGHKTAKNFSTLTGFCRMASTFPGGRETVRVARYDDDWNSLFLQPINQGVCPLAVPQIDVYDGYVGSALGNQSLGIRYGGSRTGHVRSQCTKQTLDGIADVPGILNQENTRTF